MHLQSVFQDLLVVDELTDILVNLLGGADFALLGGLSTDALLGFGASGPKLRLDVSLGVMPLERDLDLRSIHAAAE